jgi:hypothetical protein
MATSGEEFEKNYQASVRRVNNTLLNYGWAISPHHIIGSDFNELDDFCSRVEAGSVGDKSLVYAEIRKRMASYAFRPHPRAFGIYRCTQLPHLKEFSHYIERALLHYYKGDFFSCVLTIIPAIEGVLRSQVNYTAPVAKMSEMFRLLRALTPTTGEPFFVGRFPMYRDILIELLDRWIFKFTCDADFDLSYLNRHYIAHGLGQGAFYDRYDCERLFLLFDLWIEVIVCQTGLAYTNFLPDAGQNEFVDRHMAHYVSLVLEDNPIRGVQAVEELFMREHQNYKPAS